MKLIKQVNMIDVQDFDDLVQKTYGRIYNFQQQDGCKGRGTECFEVPIKDPFDYERDSLPEKVNGKIMGVSFKAWLERDPKQKLDSKDKWDREHGLSLFWERNFYPSLDMVVQDLFEKGLIPKGEYVINIDW